jgi:hypothetical protein
MCVKGNMDVMLKENMGCLQGNPQIISDAKKKTTSVWWSVGVVKLKRYLCR